MPDPNSFVVPANAGTHTPRSIVSNAHSENFLLNKRRWLWVPAFAGTTMEEQHSRHLRRHCERSEAIHSSFFAPRAGLLRFARNDVAMVLDTPSPPRRDAPEALLLSSARRGRGECRMPAAPAVSCALGSGRTHTSNNEYTGIARHSRTQWFYDLFRALLGDRALLPPSLTEYATCPRPVGPT